MAGGDGRFAQPLGAWAAATPSPQPLRSKIWKPGHRIELLENGEEFFPRVYRAIDAAQIRVNIETFILFDDEVGQALQAVLIAAAARGVQVNLTVDGYGSAELGRDFIEALTRAGVRVHFFDPRPTLFGMRTNLFRRLHRKIVVIDGNLAFIGGINYSLDHLRKSGPDSKQDYAIQIEGPVVDDLHQLTESLISAQHERPPRRYWLQPWWRRAPLPDVPRRSLAAAGNAAAALLVRDNGAHRDDIERHYRAVLRAARQRAIIANAYFVPGYRLLRAIRNAARRGVQVQLILQGNADKWITQWAGGILYDWLLAGGVKIYEYCSRPLHAKVAVVDEQWSTVGSSNLDPLSLSLNLEANVMILDADFNRLLAGRLQVLIAHHCRQITPRTVPLRTWGRQFAAFLLFHFLRRYPAWGGWLPAHRAPVRKLAAATGPAVSDSERALGGEGSRQDLSSEGQAKTAGPA